MWRLQKFYRSKLWVEVYGECFLVGRRRRICKRYWTPAFMDFVESIKAEGVKLEKRKMDQQQNRLRQLLLKLIMTI